MDDIILVRSRDFLSEGFPFAINKYCYNDFQHIKLHSHEFIEITYVCNGKGFHIMDNKRYDVSRGDLYIINFDTPHSFFPNDRDNTDKLTVYNCMFLPEFIENLNIELGILKEIINIFLYKSIYSQEMEYSPDLRLIGSAQSDIESIYDKMHREYSARQEGYIDILKIYLSELLIKIYRAYKAQNKDLLCSDRLKYQLIDASICYLKENYASKLNLEEISQHAFLSKSYFSTLFKKATGMSVFEYLQNIRIQKACQLLSSETVKVTEIAEAVGYTDYRFFNKTFKKITGLTAQEYRRKHSS